MFSFILSSVVESVRTWVVRKSAELALEGLGAFIFFFINTYTLIAMRVCQNNHNTPRAFIEGSTYLYRATDFLVSIYSL